MTAPEDDDEVVQQVLRGERDVWPPPGWWAAALLIPTSVVGSATLGLLGSKLLLENTESPGLRVLVGTGLLCVLVTAWGAGQIAIVAGYGQVRGWLLAYVRLLLVSLLPVGGLSSVDVQLPLLLTAVVGLGGAHELLRSRAYAVFTGFYRLRREARQASNP